MKRKFPKLYSEQANLEVDNDLSGNWHLTLGYHYLHALRLNSSKSINGLPNGFLSDGRQKFAPADTNFGFAGGVRSTMNFHSTVSLLPGASAAIAVTKRSPSDRPAVGR